MFLTGTSLSHSRNIENYEIKRKLGSGRYSDVYEGRCITKEIPVAIKILKPIKREKIQREIKIMQTLEDSPFVPKFIDLVKEPITRTHSIVIYALKLDNGVRGVQGQGL